MGSCRTNAGQMSFPRGIAVDGSTAYVVQSGAHQIAVWNWQTQTETTTYSPTCGGLHLNGPWGAAWDPTHTWIYIGDEGNKPVVRWSPDNPTVCQVDRKSVV